MTRNPTREWNIKRPVKAYIHILPMWVDRKNILSKVNNAPKTPLLIIYRAKLLKHDWLMWRESFRETITWSWLVEACFKRRILHASNSIHIRFDRNSLNSTFVSNVKFSMHRIQFTLRVGHNHSAACRTKTQWFSALCMFVWRNMASWQKHVNNKVAKSLKKMTIM